MKKRLLTILSLCLMGGAMAQPCSDLFISEYFEGSGFNKAIEIYNPTSSAVNLGNYQVKVYFNGSPTATGANIFTFPAVNLAPGAVYTIVNAQAVNTILLAQADTLTSGSGHVTNFNGDDAVTLWNGSTMIDAIGEIGVDPGTEWVVGATGSTLNQTLLRKVSIQEGEVVWTVGATEWDNYPQNDSTHFGAHTMTPCAPVTDTVVSFNPVAGAYNEGQNFNLTATLVNPSPVTAFTVQAVLKSGTASDINNYTTQTLNFTVNGTTASTSITITDDAIAEGSEVLTFALRNPSGAMILGSDSIFTLTINPSDQPISGVPFYPIGTVRGNDANGTPDSINVTCQVGGVVYGVNTRTTGLQFFINDHTGGIGVFAPALTYGYTVAEGDSIIVQGDVSAFNGFGQMAFLDTIIFVSASNPLRTPTVVTALDETTESELVRINNCTLVTPSQWNNSPTGFNVDITDGTNTYAMRIMPNTTTISMTAPTGAFDVIGMGGQFDNAAPFDAGYQIQPRYTQDIILLNGVEEEEPVTVSVFPNPTRGQVSLNWGASLQDVTLQVVDMTGKVVMQQQLNQVTEGQTLSLNLESKANGIYFIRVTSANVQFAKRIVLNK